MNNLRITQKEFSTLNLYSYSFEESNEREQTRLRSEELE